jgi:hypothetical protein
MSTDQAEACWWCRLRQPDSNEHRWPRSLIEKLYGPGSYVSTGGHQPIHMSGEVQRHVRSARARVLTYRSSLCARCNNERSQPFDTALIQFFHYVIDQREQLVGEQRIDFAEVFGSSFETGIDDLLRAFGKDLGCRLVESDMEIPADLVAILDHGWEAYPVIDVYLALNLGLLSSFGDSSSFLGKSDLEATLSAEDGTIRAVSYLYNVSYLSCFVGYRCRDRPVNVDRVHPRKQGVYVSWGSALSEDRLLEIREVDRSVGHNDIIDVSGRRLVNPGGQINLGIAPGTD